jgi:replicative DNA helicase
MNTASNLPKIIKEIQKGGINLVTGDSASGKTALAIQFLIEFGIRQKKTVLFLSDYEKKDSVLARILSSVTNVELLNILNKHISHEEYKKLSDIASKISNSSIFINNNDNITVKSIIKELQVLKENEINVDYILIDGIDQIANWSEVDYEKIKRSLLKHKVSLIMFGMSQFVASVKADKTMLIKRKEDEINIYLNKDYKERNICNFKLIPKYAVLV